MYDAQALANSTPFLTHSHSVRIFELFSSQCRLFIPEPIAVNRGQFVSGKMVFVANSRFSYDIFITADLEGTAISCSSVVHLHDQVLIITMSHIMYLNLMYCNCCECGWKICSSIEINDCMFMMKAYQYLATGPTTAEGF